MSVKELHFPKALNIIRPSSPLIQRHDSSYSSSTASSSSSPSTISNNSFSNNPTIVNPSNFNYFQNNWASFKSTNTVGVNPHRFLQRPRSNSNLSKSTFFSALSLSSQENDHQEEDDDDDDEDDEDDLNSSIDGLDETDEEEEEEDDDDDEDDEQEEPVVKIVAKIKHGTIMNGKGEFVNKGSNVAEESSWLDEARASRKVRNLVFIYCFSFVFIFLYRLPISKLRKHHCWY